MNKINIPKSLFGSYNWYYEQDTLRFAFNKIEFSFIAIAKHWKHVNSEGWEIYENQYHLHCTITFEKKHDELKEIADICLRLRYTNMWRDADIEEFMSNYANITVSSSYEEEVMIDCY